MKITSYEKRKYLLKEKNDLVMLSKIKKLEKYQLNEKDKEIIKLIRTQLEKEWRIPLIRYLNKLSNRYKK